MKNKKNAAGKLVNEIIWWTNRTLFLRPRTDGKFRLQVEKRTTAKLKRILDRQMNWLVKEAKKLSAFQSNRKNAASTEDLAQISVIVSKLPEKEALVQGFMEAAEVVMLKGGKTAVTKLQLGKFGIAFDLKHPQAVKYLNERKTLELSNYKGNIDGTTKRGILKVLREAAETGQSYNETAKMILNLGKEGVFSEARAKLIATKETSDAYAEGKKAPVQDFIDENPDRKVTKDWHTVGDDRVTEECNANQGEGTLPFDKPFNSGDQQAPRQSNPRCRCDSSYAILPPK